MSFTNAYEDERMAEAYSKLEFPATYYLAYRDLPRLFAEHARGRRALDFGCGAGRSSRFLAKCGFEVTGIDIAESMLRQAREIDPAGDYRLVPEGDFSALSGVAFDAVLAAFTFDNVPTREKKLSMLSDLARLLSAEGRMFVLVSSPEIYVHEWASFSTKDFPENRQAGDGDVVRIINTAIEDRRPVEDVVFSDRAYREVFAAAGLAVVETHHPLARADEPFQWVNETRISPWTIYVLSAVGLIGGRRVAPRPPRSVRDVPAGRSDPE
jgi:ubiquinone/menaquinone biosynthesis C-methylase UbiE